MNKVALTLVCGDFKLPIESPITISNTSLGCSMVGGNDLYDLGFKHTQLQIYGLQIYYGDILIVSLPAENI